MIVITRNGRTSVVTGWRAWALGLGAIVMLWVAFSVAAVVLVGTALSIGLLFLFVVPAAGVFLLVQTAIRNRR